jgi:PleD family two-component response regulator
MQLPAVLDHGTMREFQPKGGILIRSPRRRDTEVGRPPLIKRILVVDDEEAMGRLITRNLEPDGHAVTLMTDTNGALDAIDAGDTFDLYIIDVNMPARKHEREREKIEREERRVARERERARKRLGLGVRGVAS